MHLKVFIGSAEKDKKYAKAVARILQKQNVTPIGWWERGVFPVGKTLSESLEKVVVRRANAAILIAGPGDAVRRGGKVVWQPRDNVVLEYGMFVAARGRERVGLAAFKKVELPSDIGGVLNMQLRERKPFSERKFIADNTEEIQKWLDPLLNQPPELGSIDRCWATVGDIQRLVLDELVPEISSGASEIDMLSIYRPVEKALYSNLGKFRTGAGNRLRVCFANVWDPVLAEVYKRKITGKPPGYFENALAESIRRYLGDEAMIDTANPSRIRVTTKAAIAATYQVYLTPQRITYTYCRVGDVMMIIPLDMKKAQQPSPFGWVIRADDAPDAFQYYRDEFEMVIAESQRIYGRKKAGPPVV